MIGLTALLFGAVPPVTRRVHKRYDDVAVVTLCILMDLQIIANQ